MRVGPLVVLLVEDNEDDVIITRRALREVQGADVDLRVARDGVEALDYVYRRGLYSDAARNPSPHLILLDINMPRLDGFGVLKRLKTDADHRSIPIVVLTTSTAERDVERAYREGANSYVIKPESFDRFVEIMKIICMYWSQACAVI